MEVGELVYSTEGERAYDPARIVAVAKPDPIQGRFGSRPNRYAKKYICEYDDGTKMEFMSTDVHRTIFYFKEENV